MNEETKAELERNIAVLKDLDPTTREYKEIVKSIKILRDVEEETSETSWWKPILGTGLVQLSGMAFVMLFERNGIITSRAWSLIQKASRK